MEKTGNKMKKEFYCCSNCEKILKNNEGIIIQGNIYVADDLKSDLMDTCQFEYVIDDTKYIKETCLCGKCFMERMIDPFRQDVYATSQPLRR